MQPIQPFDPSTATYGTVPGVMLPNGGSIVLINKSPYELWVTFESRDTMDVPAWTARLYQTCERVTSVTWQYAQGWTPSGQSGAPSSLVSLELYGPQEKVPENYPVALTRLVSVGNQISTTGSTSMKNDGQAPGTSVIEATPSDQASSALQINNDGSGTWAILSAGAQRTLFSIVRGNATTGHAVVDIGDAADKSAFTFHGYIGSIHSDVNAISSDGAGNLTAVSFNGPLHGNADTATNATNATSATSATTAGAVSSNGGSTSTPQLQTGTAGAGLAVVDDKANGLMHVYPTENDATLRSLQLDYVDATGARKTGPHVTTDDHPWRWPGHLVDGQGNDFVIGTTFSGTGTGTYSFTFFGSPQKTPRTVTITMNELNSTATVGVDSMGTGSVHVNEPSTAQWPFYGWVGIC